MVQFSTFFSLVTIAIYEQSPISKCLEYATPISYFFRTFQSFLFLCVFHWNLAWMFWPRGPISFRKSGCKNIRTKIKIASRSLARVSDFFTQPGILESKIRRNTFFLNVWDKSFRGGKTEVDANNENNESLASPSVINLTQSVNKYLRAKKLNNLWWITGSLAWRISAPSIFNWQIVCCFIFHACCRK